MVEAIDVVFVHSQKGEKLAAWYADIKEAVAKLESKGVSFFPFTQRD